MPAVSSGGSGTFTVIALASVSDGGAVTDTGSILRQTEVAHESGHVTEQMTVFVVATVRDGGAGSDGTSEAATGGAHMVSDSAAGSDMLSVARFQVIGDSALGISAERITRTDIASGASVSGVFVQDFGAGSDVMMAQILAGMADGGTGSEAMTVLGSGGAALLITLSDGGTGSDSPSAPARTGTAGSAALWWD